MATSATLAPLVENPVEVLTKSAPVFATISAALAISSFVNKAFSIMTLIKALLL